MCGSRILGLVLKFGLVKQSGANVRAASKPKKRIKTLVAGGVKSLARFRFVGLPHMGVPAASQVIARYAERASQKVVYDMGKSVVSARKCGTREQWKRCKESYSFYKSTATQRLRGYQLHSGDIFTISLKQLYDVCSYSNCHYMLVPVRRYKKIVWYKPTTWFRILVDIKFLELRKDSLGGQLK